MTNNLREIRGEGSGIGADFPPISSVSQAAHCHTLGPKLGASSLTRNLAGLGVKVFYLYRH
jgi:hypothetical protein